MKIGGLQKLSLLDFPEHTCCTVFTCGCNFRCPYCHNASLVGGEGRAQIEPKAVLAFLEKRRGLLDGVCVTGGEPLLQADLADFLRAVRALGFAIKLDTNGSRPKALKALVAEGLLDYVAMDVKSAPAQYASAVGLVGFDTADVEESIDFLLAGAVPCEFRTTAVAQLHSDATMAALARRIRGAQRYFLQCYAASSDVLCPGLAAPSRAQLARWLAIARREVPQAELRGVQL